MIGLYETISSWLWHRGNDLSNLPFLDESEKRQISLKLQKGPNFHDMFMRESIYLILQCQRHPISLKNATVSGAGSMAPPNDNVVKKFFT